MDFIREVRHIKNNKVVISLPDEFIDKDIEFIMLPYIDSEKLGLSHSPKKKSSGPFLEKVMKEELNRMNEGFHLGGGPYYHSRDELHE